MSARFVTAMQQTMWDDLMGKPGKKVVVAVQLHARPRGKAVRVPVFGMAFVDTGKDYRGRIGAKDKARRERALGVSA